MKRCLIVLGLCGLLLAACRPATTPTVTAVMSTSLPTATSATQTQAPTATPTATATTAPTATALSPTSTPAPPTAPPEAVAPTPDPRFPAASLPLSAFPRPPDDNGLGIHWSTHLYAQSDEATSYFVSELTLMNIKWVKLLNDSTGGHHYDHTIDELVKQGIMPVLRLYQRCNNRYNQAELAALVQHYVAKGVYYYDLYNEPNQPGESGGWCDGDGKPDAAYLAEAWAEAARTIYLAGGYPGLPSFFAPDQKLPDWQDAFFYRFFEALREQGNEHLLYFAWGSIHNYNINHPPTYPYDEVNQTGKPLTEAEIVSYELTEPEVQEINRQRRIGGILKERPLTEADGAELGLDAVQIADINRKFAEGAMMGFTIDDDSTAFFHFMAYRNQFYELFGFEIPLISTEGGATKGSHEDPRYPKVSGQTVAEWTLWTADHMLDEAPDYYFATSTWLLAQNALDYPHPVWEENAWYHDRSGDQEPVVEALKNRPRKDEARYTIIGRP